MLRYASAYPGADESEVISFLEASCAVIRVEKSCMAETDHIVGSGLNNGNRLTRGYGTGLKPKYRVSRIAHSV